MSKKFSKFWWVGGGLMLAIMALSSGAITLKPLPTNAEGCPDVKIIFARGSGEERFKDRNYQDFKSAMVDKLASTHLSYAFSDLDYPAISVANPLTLLTTFVSGGEAYEFGASVSDGVSELKKEVNDSECVNTKYVLAGYSQGAMAVSKALPFLNSDKIIYAATFGDPKLYLPEGAGPVPAACSGQNLSNYRIYVPDCRAYSGMLGGYNPYQPADYIDKLGTWCNKADFFCSSYLSMRDHTSYVADGIYKEASKTIFSKIVDAFGIENNYVSLHDTAILIDSTGSMSDLIEKYKTEALNLAFETFRNNGRVALYDYRDLDDSYDLNEHCNFTTCTAENFKEMLDEIEVDGGGNLPESLLSNSLKMMQKLDWKYGATKSVVVLTDAGYHDPDLDGTTFDQVVRLSKSIDPVNFYIITPENTMSEYERLAAATDGAVASSASSLSLLTQQIMERYDSLPRVEEEDFLAEELPTISDVKWTRESDNSVRISWQNTGTRALVALNDAVLGMTEADFIVISDLDFAVETQVTLVPMNETRRGESANVNLDARGDIHAADDVAKTDSEITTNNIIMAGNVIVPKAPNTGKKF